MRLIIAIIVISNLIGCWTQRTDAPTSGSSIETDTAVQVPVGKFFLIRSGKLRAAVKLTNKINKGDGGYEYVWYWQSDGSGIFTNSNAKSGKGEVFEKYYQRSKNKDGGGLVVNDGGVLYIYCNNITVKWSMSNWVYFHSPNGSVEIAVTNHSNIENINYLNNKLVWHRQKK